jgi:hypothetical protein
MPTEKGRGKVSQILKEGLKFLWAGWEGQGEFGGVADAGAQQKTSQMWGKPSNFDQRISCRTLPPSPAIRLRIHKAHTHAGTIA